MITLSDVHGDAVGLHLEQFVAQQLAAIALVESEARNARLAGVGARAAAAAVSAGEDPTAARDSAVQAEEEKMEVAATKAATSNPKSASRKSLKQLAKDYLTKLLTLTEVDLPTTVVAQLQVRS